MLSAADPLPFRPRRILVAGVSGAGKTTLAARIGAVLPIPATEIDGLFHGPNWVPRTDFADDVDRLTQEPGWVTEWQYGAVRPLLASRADTLVWLDFPLWLSMSRLIRRTVRRRRRREVLWNGNVEAPLHTVFTHPEHIIRWGWRTRNKLKPLVPALESECPQLCVVRLASQADVEAWLSVLAAAPAPSPSPSSAPATDPDPA